MNTANPQPDPDPMEARRLIQHARQERVMTVFELGGIVLREHIIRRDTAGEPSETDLLELEWLDHRRREILAGIDKAQRRTRRRSSATAKAAPNKNAPLREQRGIAECDRTGLECAPFAVPFLGSQETAISPT